MAKVFLIVIAAMSLLAAAASAAARARPDLIETKVSVAPVYVIAGGALTVHDTTVNRGKVAAKASVTRYYIGGGNPAVHALVGSRKVGPLKPGASAPGKRLLQTSRSLPAGHYSISACTDDTRVVQESNEANNCTASNSFTVKKLPPPA